MMHIELLREKQNSLQQQMTDFYTPRGLHVYFKDQLLNNDINVEAVIAKAEDLLPHHLCSEVEMVIVGHFDEFEEKGFNAFYDSGTICVTNSQFDEADMLDDIIHEFAHSVEEPYGVIIYGDSKVKDEFLQKRHTLHDILWKSGFKAPKSFFNDIDYDAEFDNFLYKKIGYDKLQTLCAGVFISPYAPTSLREYFATGFTEFFLHPDGHNYLKKVSPHLYNKILEIYSDEDVDSY